MAPPVLVVQRRGPAGAVDRAYFQQHPKAPMYVRHPLADEFAGLPVRDVVAVIVVDARANLGSITRIPVANDGRTFAQIEAEVLDTAALIEVLFADAEDDG